MARRASRRAGRRDAGAGADDGLRAAPAARIVGRAEAARRAGARAGQDAEAAAARRAAGGARPQIARGDAARADRHPGAGRHHFRGRDARPGRGARHGLAHRGDERGPASCRSARAAEIYERPNSRFVADFVGDGESVRRHACRRPSTRWRSRWPDFDEPCRCPAARSAGADGGRLGGAAGEARLSHGAAGGDRARPRPSTSIDYQGGQSIVHLDDRRRARIARHCRARPRKRSPAAPRLGELGARGGVVLTGMPAWTRCVIRAMRRLWVWRHAARLEC